MNPVRDLPQTTGIVVDVLERMNLPYALGGALAQNFWGTVRATQDIDVLVAVPRIRFQELADALSANGFRMRDSRGQLVPVTAPAMAAEDRDHRHVTIYRGTVKVELFLPFLALQNSILKRAVRLPMGPRKVSVTTAEDLILLKLAFHRDKDLIDVRAMLWSQSGRLDLAYLREWAKQMLEDETLAELEELIRDYSSGRADGAPR